MSAHFDPIQYKILSKANWNTVAPEYHFNWAAKHIGPFKSTIELVNEASIKQDDKILDLACGTGVVSKEISQHLSNTGFIVGIDLSRTALVIAKQTVRISNASFIEMDAENLGFNFAFDKILCQYALMFFPNVKKVLDSVKNILKSSGKFVLAVHGTSEEVPYFSAIMNSVLKYIPDVRPEGTPTVHRFGNPNDLRRELEESGFIGITIRRYTFSYEAGSFKEYWHDYMHSTANSIRPKIESHGTEVVFRIKKESEQNVAKYTRNGKITFPWSILLASALK